MKTANVLIPMLLAAICCLVLPQAQALPQPGKRFPWYDNCRKATNSTRLRLDTVGPFPRVDTASKTAEFCFKVSVARGAKCANDFLRPTRNGPLINSRCCDMSFAKIKIYTNPACWRMLAPGQLTVPKKNYKRSVSPRTDAPPKFPALYTQSKYTQFGPFEQNVLDGTTFCIKTVQQPGLPSSCKYNDLRTLIHPADVSRNKLQVALFDRKKDNYECCPTYSWDLSSLL